MNVGSERKASPLGQGGSGWPVTVSSSVSLLDAVSCSLAVALGVSVEDPPCVADSDSDLDSDSVDTAVSVSDLVSSSESEAGIVSVPPLFFSGNS